MIDAHEYDRDHVEYRGVFVVRLTARGMLVEIDEQERWLGRRHVHAASTVGGEGSVGTLIVPKWVAHEFDLVDSA